MFRLKWQQSGLCTLHKNAQSNNSSFNKQQRTVIPCKVTDWKFEDQEIPSIALFKKKQNKNKEFPDSAEQYAAVLSVIIPTQQYVYVYLQNKTTLERSSS